MTTCSSSPRSNEPAIPNEPNGSAQPSAETTVATGTYQVEQTSTQPADAHRAGPAGAEPVALGSHPVAGSGGQPTAPDRPTARPYAPAPEGADPAGGGRRPHHLAEELPDHTQAKVDALRTAGVTRPVKNVSRLIALLTKPPRDADCADEAIRAAAAHRPVEEVTRLVTLLHKEPQEPHVREEALRAAATGRTVGELVELIDRLGLERLDRTGRPPNGTSRPGGTAADPRGARPAGQAPSGTVLVLLLVLRPVAVVLAGSVLVPTVLAGAQAYGSSFPAASLSRAVDLALAPPWLAAAVAVCATLLALVALVFRVLAPIASRQWEPAPAPEAGSMAE
ncbi:hypothetical protein ABZ568_22325 [Streptomyces olindensis]|uniref:Uncharacterized protein n=1 Tax=Streptomyces olindensis TaxID=358823 RepID=A0ABV2XYR5_9ACTN